jgi:hypothetical protein
MAAASYTTDLSIHTDATSTTGFAEATGFTRTDGAGVVDTDLAIYGDRCITESQRKDGKGSLVFTSGTSRTIPTDGAFFIWFKWFAPNATINKSLGGIQVFIGNTSANFRQYYVNGRDTYPYGGWVNYAVNPTTTESATTGSPNTTYNTAGIGVDLSVGISKGNSFNIDIMRYGRGEVIITDGDLANGYADFDGIATENDNPTLGRWGLFQDAGGSYLYKGLLTFGVTATSVDFRDSNKSITIDNTEFVTSNFNKIEINNAASNVEWTSISFSSISTVSRGNFEVVDNATVDLESCNFNAMGTFIFLSNSTLGSTSFNQCDQVTQGGASIDTCTFNESIGATSLLVSDITAIGTCTFVSDGSNHAIELTTVPATYTFPHTATGYATGALGIEGTDFTAGSTGNETLYINATSAQDIVITIPAGITTPSIRRGASYTGQITVQVQAKTIDVNVKDEDGVNVSGAFVYINDGVTTIFNGTTDASGNIPQQSYSGTNNSTLRVRKFGDKPFETTLGTASGSVSQLVTLINDRQQIAVPTLNNTWTINTSLETITMTSGPTLPFSAYSAIDTSQNLYEFVMNTFAATAFMQFEVPLESITDVQYNFLNGYTFGAKDNDYKFLYSGSFTDAANNLLWSNVKTIGTVETGTGIYVVQGVEASDAALTSWWPDGNVDILIKVQDGTFIQSTDDTATNVNGAVWLFAREYGDLYDHFFSDLSGGGQSIVALSTNEDLNNTTASGTVATYTDITLTFGSLTRDIGDGNGLQPYAAEVDCNGRPLDEVYEYLKYITSFDFSQTVNGDDGYEYRNADEANFSNVDNKQAPFGTFAGGRFFGAQGVFLTNMAGADSTNFQLIDSNGVLRFPPLTVTFELTGLKDGTEVRIYDASDTSDVAGVETITAGSGTGATAGVTITGTTDNSTFAYQYIYSADINIIVVVVNLNFQNIYLEGLTLTNTNQSIPIAQVIDRQYLNP